MRLGGLDPSLGSEIKKTRPAVIVSNWNLLQRQSVHGSWQLPRHHQRRISYRGERTLLINVPGRDRKAYARFGNQIRSLDKSR